MEKTFLVTVKETREKTVQIRAEDKEQAERIARGGMREKKLVLGVNDIQSVSCDAVEKEPEKVYKVAIREVYTVEKPIHAYSREDAIQKAERAYEDYEYSGLFTPEVMEVFFEAVETKEKKKEMQER